MATDVVFTCEYTEDNSVSRELDFTLIGLCADSHFFYVDLNKGMSYLSPGGPPYCSLLYQRALS